MRLTRDMLIAELMKYPNLPVVKKESVYWWHHLYTNSVSLMRGRTWTGYESGMVSQNDNGKQEYIVID